MRCWSLFLFYLIYFDCVKYLYTKIRITFFKEKKCGTPEKKKKTDVALHPLPLTPNTNGHNSTTGTFLCLQGGHYGDVQLDGTVIWICMIVY